VTKNTHTHTLSAKAGLWMKTLHGEAFSWVTASSKTHCVFLALPLASPGILGFIRMLDLYLR